MGVAGRHGPLLRGAGAVARRTGLQTAFGTPEALLAARHRARQPATLDVALAACRARMPTGASTPEDEPLFVLSAGWRSGSTMLQRLLLSGGSYFLWGEPYHRADTVRRLAESLLPFAEGWPPDAYVYDSEALTEAPGEELSSTWIANLYPPLATLLDSHRALLRTLLAAPAAHPDLGWGMKEVRFTADHAGYLRLLFPRARIVLLVRNPVDAWISYRSRPFWFDTWPDGQVRTPQAFGRHWARVAGSFRGFAHDEHSALVRFEDLFAVGPAIAKLERVLGAAVDQRVLSKRIGGSEPVRDTELGPLESRLLARETAEVARAFGYGGTSGGARG